MSTTELNKSHYLRYLYLLTNSEVDLKALAKYLTLYKTDEVAIFEILNYVYNKSGSHHQLVLFYLCFEVIKLTDGLILKDRMKEFISNNYLNSKTQANDAKVLKRFNDFEKILRQKEIVK
ncbi:hypothetical protein A0H76_1619 [Hepatospora eriocheir]|uniref:Uncharacterized protein n=1 Tax=Hepatospora eriocheir TaxID=1081669 RepID=A0A1X0QB67_9MICR|nr:hypothetical protein HERIO_1059 [Hepatospora eriocheir]ORD98974.1 hypothetical protein A0H76_1619 [Hepatospora eriocheir]